MGRPPPPLPPPASFSGRLTRNRDGTLAATIVDVFGQTIVLRGWKAEGGYHLSGHRGEPRPWTGTPFVLEPPPPDPDTNEDEDEEPSDA